MTKAVMYTLYSDPPLAGDEGKKETNVYATGDYDLVTVDHRIDGTLMIYNGGNLVVSCLQVQHVRIVENYQESAGE